MLCQAAMDMWTSPSFYMQCTLPVGKGADRKKSSDSTLWCAVMEDVSSVTSAPRGAPNSTQGPWDTSKYFPELEIEVILCQRHRHMIKVLLISPRNSLVWYGMTMACCMYKKGQLPTCLCKEFELPCRDNGVPVKHSENGEHRYIGAVFWILLSIFHYFKLNTSRHSYT